MRLASLLGGPQQAAQFLHHGGAVCAPTDMSNDGKSDGLRHLAEISQR